MLFKDFNFSVFKKVSGRMGMIVTLYLISTNVYNSVDAPRNRGFSYIELWLLGTQFPILLALCEYGFVLYLKKLPQKSTSPTQSMDFDTGKSNLNRKIRKLDYGTMAFSLFCFISFVSLYWIISPS